MEITTTTVGELTRRLATLRAQKRRIEAQIEHIRESIQVGILSKLTDIETDGDGSSDPCFDVEGLDFKDWGYNGNESRDFCFRTKDGVLEVTESQIDGREFIKVYVSHSKLGVVDLYGPFESRASMRECFRDKSFIRHFFTTIIPRVDSMVVI